MTDSPNPSPEAVALRLKTDRRFRDAMRNAISRAEGPALKGDNLGIALLSYPGKVVCDDHSGCIL
jgi:hypothetical protein